MNEEYQNDWCKPADRYSRYFDTRARALAARGIEDPAAVFYAEQNPDVTEAVAEMESLVMMGAAGSRQVKIWDPELELHYHLLHPLHKCSGVEFEEWLRQHPTVLTLPFWNPRWLQILHYRREAPDAFRFFEKPCYDTFIESLTSKGNEEPQRQSRCIARDELVEASHDFSYNQAVACLILPDQFRFDQVIHDPANQNDFTGANGVEPIHMGRYYAPLTVRMVLLWMGYRIAKEEEIAGDIPTQPSYLVDNGHQGLRCLGSDYEVHSHERTEGGLLLAKPLGRLIECPECTNGSRSHGDGKHRGDPCWKCEGHRRVVVHYSEDD